jgi:hypothetical protein
VEYPLVLKSTDDSISKLFDFYTICRDPFLWIKSEHFTKKLIGLLENDYVLFWIISRINLFVKLFICTSAVREVTSQHNKHHHTQSPNISSLTSVFFLLNYFRSHIARCSTKDLHLNYKNYTFVCFSMQVLKPKSIILGFIFSSRIIF